MVWYVVKICCERVGLEHIAPHDLRRTCSKLCHDSGGELDYGALRDCVLGYVIQTNKSTAQSVPPSQIATEATDLGAEQKRGLAFVRKQAGHKKKAAVKDVGAYHWT